LEFHTSLLRERFVIHDAMPAGMEEEEPVIALSNRLIVSLQDVHGKNTEIFIVRAQNMHSCLRMAARMAGDFSARGPLLNHSLEYRWEKSWQSITKGYEEKWNPDRWVAIYHKGRIIFEGGEGERHSFLDIIEQCDTRNKDDYEKTIIVAEDAFKQAGKLVTIEHDANVACIINISGDEAKCGIILRGPNRTTTFNFTARKKAGRDIKISQCLTVSAAFLEGIQLAFFIGMTHTKLQYQLIEKTSKEAKKLTDSSRKLGRLNSAISQFNNLLDVSYRPDRPDFGKMIDEAKEFAREAFAADIQRKMAEGMDDGEWVV